MEIETKFKTKNLEAIKKKLVKLGAVFSDEVDQKDEWYRWKGQELASQHPGSFMIRIRNQNGVFYFGTKELTNKTGVWIEYELQISDAEEMKKIINQLGFTKVFTLTKKRIPGRLEEFGLCLDDVKELGKYLEVEVISDNPDEGKEKIRQLMTRLGIDDREVEHRGYGAIILQSMGVKYEGVDG